MCFLISGGLSDESKVMVLLRMKQCIGKLASLHQSYNILKTRFLSFLSKGKGSLLKYFIVFACDLYV